LGKEIEEREGRGQGKRNGKRGDWKREVMRREEAG